MENIFIINPAATPSDITDAIHRKLDEAQAISNCLSGAEHEMPALWAISDLLDDIKRLYDIENKL